MIALRSCIISTWLASFLDLHTRKPVSRLMNQMISHKVACKQRQLARRVTRSAGLISRGAVGMRGGHIAIFLPVNTFTGLIETDLDLDGTVHFTGGRARWGGVGGESARVSVRVLMCVRVWVEGEHKWDSVFTTERVWKHELDEHGAPISLWRYGVPRPNFGSRRGAIFSAYHSSFIMVWLLHRCYLARGQQMSHCWSLFQNSSPVALAGRIVYVCLSSAVYGCAPPNICTPLRSVFVCERALSWASVHSFHASLACGGQFHYTNAWSTPYHCNFTNSFGGGNGRNGIDFHQSRGDTSHMFGIFNCFCYRCHRGLCEITSLSPQWAFQVL